MKEKSFRNTATYQKTRGGGYFKPPPPSSYHSGGVNLRVRSRVKTPGKLIYFKPIWGGGLICWEGLNLFRKDDGISCRVQEGWT